MKKRANGEKGQSLVEFAMMLPVLILVLCGIIDFGWVYSNQLLVEFGARDGARYAAINAADSNLSTLVSNRVKTNAGVSKPENLVTTTTKINSNVDVSVQVQYPVTILTPVASTFLGKTFTVKATCIMRIE